jgi:hypothetical protein
MSVVEVELKNEVVQPEATVEPTVEPVKKKGRPRKIVEPKEPKVIPTVTKVDVKEVVLKEEKLPKVKRELTEKQKEAFKKGQEALKLYREKQKEAKEAKRQEVLDKKIEEVKAVSPDAKIVVKKIQQRRKKSDPPPPLPKAKKSVRGRPRKVEDTSATSCTEADTTDYPSESDTESDSSIEKKYVRKATRRINAVRKIEETIQKHTNPYHNMSVF